MRAGWRIAINSLATRRGRTALLVIAVAFATSLLVSVTASIDSVNGSMRISLTQMLGSADVRIRHQTQGRLDDDLLSTVNAWSEVETAIPRLSVNLGVQNNRTEEQAIITCHGIDVLREWDLHPVTMEEGRLPANDSEVIIDPRTADKLEVEVGDVLTIGEWGPTFEVTVVGIHKRISLAILQKPEIRAPLSVVQGASGFEGKVSMIAMGLKNGRDPHAMIEARRGEVEFPAELVPSDLLLAGLDRQLRGGDLMYYLTAMLAFLCTAFIVLTGMTTAVTQRIRELAILRCIGASRAHVFQSQLYVGALIGGLGGVIGTPLGALFAWILYATVGDFLQVGLHITPTNIITAIIGSVGSGMIGASIPAWAGSRVSPLIALRIRSRTPRPRGLITTTIVGLVCVIGATGLLWLPYNEQYAFWAYVGLGLPALVLGWFILSVPAVYASARLLARPISRLFRLPPQMLESSITGTPYRHGFTAGALMLGLATMVSTWSHGSGVLRDWLTPLRFPDAFVFSMSDFDDEVIDIIASQPFVTQTCAIADFTVPAEQLYLGVKGIAPKRVTYIAFEPEPFFEMTNLEWAEGSLETALPRLIEGGAILVAREFLTARGVGVGDRLMLGPEDNKHEFEVVGVVSSPGLDIATSFFGIQGEFHEQAISCVFGSRADAIRCFGHDDVSLIQFDLSDDVTDEEAKEALLAEARKRSRSRFSIVEFGSGRMIKNMIQDLAGQMMTMASFIAFAALAVAGLGMANVIAANIASRQFEYGVLRAVGATRGLLFRLILCESLLMAIGACVTGTALGFQDSWNGLYVYRILAGLIAAPHLPFPVLIIGVGLVLFIAIAATLPAIWRLMKQSPCGLLADSAAAG